MKSACRAGVNPRVASTDGPRTKQRRLCQGLRVMARTHTVTQPETLNRSGLNAALWAGR
jgi:hypothetical protein